MSDKLKPSGYLARIQKEIKTLRSSSSEGITAWPRNEEELVPIAEESSHEQHLSGVWIDADITPPSYTPYAFGTFRVECCLTRAFPFCPPHCKFVTPIYHPNIDTQGRICVDILKEGTDPGKWKVTYNLITVLSVIRQLLAEPNPDDPLEADIAAEYKCNKFLFESKAREKTLQHAKRPLHTVQTPLECPSSTLPTSFQTQSLASAPTPAPVPPAPVPAPALKRKHSNPPSASTWLTQMKKQATQSSPGAFGMRPSGFAKLGGVGSSHSGSRFLPGPSVQKDGTSQHTQKQMDAKKPPA